MNDTTVTIRSKPWTIRFVRGPLQVKGEEVDGYVYWDQYEIRIDRRLKGLSLVDAVLHEINHVAYPDMNEDTVTNGSTDAANALAELDLLSDA